MMREGEIKQVNDWAESLGVTMENAHEFELRQYSDMPLYFELYRQNQFVGAMTVELGFVGDTNV